MAIRRTSLIVTVGCAAWLCAGPVAAGPAGAVASTGTCEESSTGSQALREGASPNTLTLRADALLDDSLQRVPGRTTRWSEAPGLIVLTSVMEYQGGERTEYYATSDRLSDQEAGALVDDLTGALSALTGEVFTGFAEIHKEFAPAGAAVTVKRPGQIVVGRYRGVRDQLNTIGVGGRFRSGQAITAGTVFLDEEYDRTNSRRGLLRTHELGHALGYDHVESRPSIMNSRIGAGLTEFDRLAAFVAFRSTPAPLPSCPSL